ncbi:MAG: peptide chain release factor N(5)-glutamine methyltransferase [Candidatus Delongbacteria bacterium]|nr:peptide chain release factor N(5)-glutamine methyltransferase [Candidatus Delongbacteria bacterium]
MKTLIEILDLSSEHLKKKGVSEPRLSAELLICFALKIKRLDIYLQYDRILTEAETSLIRNYLRRRSDHEPVQYITGRTEFYGLMFKVDRNVLIPRQDTEVLVSYAAELIGQKDLRVLEIGTGSGCIAVSLAHVCKNISVTATDISQKALDVASENARLNKINNRINFIKHDILTQIMNERYDVIISNPPYIMKKTIQTLDPQVTEFEPLIALTDGGDGLAFYRRIETIIPEILKPGGMLFLEIGYDQAEKVTDIYKKSLENISVTRDLSDNPRVFSGILKA